MVDIQVQINAKDKDTTLDITYDGSTATTPADLWAGKAVIKDFKKIKKIDIEKSDITELIVENCPDLEEIDLSDSNNIKRVVVEKAVIDTSNNNGTANKIKIIKVSGNDKGLDELNLKNCKSLGELTINNLGEIKVVKGEKDFDKPIKDIKMDGSSGLHVTTTEELERLETIEKAAEEAAGGDIPKIKDPITGKEVVDSDALKNKIQATANPQAAADKESAEKESKAVKEELGGVEAERDQLKQRLEAINKELGLGNNATEQQVINKIKELMGRPTTACTHTDYDTIKSERDSLQNEVETKKRKISELEETSKENVITKKVLVDNTNTSWKDWGIKLTDEQKEKIQTASSATEVENARNEIIKSEFNKLKGKNDSSTILNVGFGVLAIGSLLILGWVLMKQNNSLPSVEPKKEKEK